MAIALDASSSKILATTQVVTWEHTPVGTPTFVLVLINDGATKVDRIATVKYGGRRMARVEDPLIHVGGGPFNAVLHAFVLSDPPSGKRTIEVEGESPLAMTAAAYTLTGNLIRVSDIKTLSSSKIKTPTVTLTTYKEPTLVFASLFTDILAAELTPNASYTQTLESEAFGVVSSYISRTAASSTGSIVASWTNAGIEEDAGLFAVAVSEGTVPAVVTGREYPPDQIALRIEAGNGTAARWAEDEPAAENILSDIMLEDEIPGGYKSVKGSLARDPHLDWRDLEEFAKMVAYQPGIEVVGEGFLDKGPGSSGERQLMSPEALGWQAVLHDNNAAKVGFIDTDLNKFGEPTAERRKILLAALIRLMADVSTGLSSLDPAGTAPGVIIDFNNVESVGEAATEAGEAHYYTGGPDLGKIMYDFRQLSAGGGSANWEDSIAAGRTDTYATEPLVGTNHAAADAFQQTINIAVPGYKWVRIRDRLSAASENVKLARTFAWQNIKILGRHELPLKGAWPNVGFTAQQMLVYLINTFAYPLEASEASVEDGGFVIPQAWYDESGGLAEIVEDIVKYELYDWFCYHGRLFENREPGSYGRFWKAYVVPSELNELGIDSQRLWRSIVVQYTDSSGRTRSVGPPGSVTDVETAALEITDLNHPAVLAQRTRRDILDLRGIGSAEIAIKVGERFLEEANLLPRSGSAKLSGYVLDNNNVFWPVANVKSGDWISFVDSHDTSYRKIVRKTYTHNDRSSEIDIDAPPSGLDALLERLNAGLISLGVA